MEHWKYRTAWSSWESKLWRYKFELLRYERNGWKTPKGYKLGVGDVSLQFKLYNVGWVAACSKKDKQTKNDQIRDIIMVDYLSYF